MVRCSATKLTGEDRREEPESDSPSLNHSPTKAGGDNKAEPTAQKNVWVSRNANGASSREHADAQPDECIYRSVAAAGTARQVHNDEPTFRDGL